MKSELTSLISKVCESYKVAGRLKVSALNLDPRALKQLGSIVGSRVCRLSPLETHEVTKWGVLWEMSRFTELRRFQN